MSYESPDTDKPRRSFDEIDAYLGMREAKLRAAREANRAEKLKHTTARVRRIGEIVIAAAERGDPRCKELAAEADASIAKDADQRKAATQKKRADSKANVDAEKTATQLKNPADANQAELIAVNVDAIEKAATQRKETAVSNQTDLIGTMTPAKKKAE